MREIHPDQDPAGTERFWLKVRKGDGCWEWQGGTNMHGYGMASFGGIQVRAHRLSYALAHGDIPAGAVICHHCDNPPCVNPAHLYAGTQADNNRDRDSRGRSNYSKALRGEIHGSAKLKNADVREIHARLASGAATQDALAQEYGVSFSAISLIAKGKTWKVLGLSREALPYQISHGERHPNAKMTLATAQEMRELRTRDGVSQRELAHRFGVSQPTVSHILKNVNWLPLSELP